MDQTGVQHGFIQDNIGKKDRPVIVMDYPNATSTALEDISDSLVASGQWSGSDGNPHAFTADVSDVRNIIIKDLDPKDGSTYQQAWGINDHGLVALSTSAGRLTFTARRKIQINAQAPAVRLMIAPP